MCTYAAAYNGCGMISPCDSDDGSVTGDSWCEVVDPASCSPAGETWDYCTPQEPGCGGRSHLTGKTECDAECEGLAFVASTGICTGCQDDGTTPITAETVGGLTASAVWCPSGTGR